MAASKLGQIWSFLRVRKKWWLTPIIVFSLLLSALIVATQGSAVAPFIYTLFYTTVSRKVAVIGLGYVGLPVALAFARRYGGTIAFDVSSERIEDLSRGVDTNADVLDVDLSNSSIRFTHAIEDLAEQDFYIVAVPTPIDDNKRPDLSYLQSASEKLGSLLKEGDIVVYESTVYPGVTEEFCGPILEKVSGLRQGIDFKLGYSPERINPGDTEHTLEKIVKVVAAEDQQSLNVVAEMYASIIDAGVHIAPSIKVAEAAKVIENTQRDLNIALMNELAIIFDRMSISTKDVIDAASTKWNFLPFNPGLVGGHCIGVDPYYLTSKAEQLGYLPQVILAGRRINDGMGSYIAEKTVKLLAQSGLQVGGAKVGVMGITFKENVSDIRNSRVPDIVRELKEYGVNVLVHDPLAEAEEVEKEHGISLVSSDELNNLDALILAVCHKEFIAEGSDIQNRVQSKGLLVDVKSSLSPEAINQRTYWSL